LVSSKEVRVDILIIGYVKRDFSSTLQFGAIEKRMPLVLRGNLLERVIYDFGLFSVPAPPFRFAATGGVFYFLPVRL
jgi:hypothetical protein